MEDVGADFFDLIEGGEFEEGPAGPAVAVADGVDGG